MGNPFGGIWLIRCVEVVRFLEGLLWEVPLYLSLALSCITIS